MSLHVFATEILKPISQKVVLVEIDIGKLNSFWVNYRAGVWIVNFNNVYAKLTTFTTVPAVADIIIVGSVTANGIQLRKVSSPLTCEEIDSCFYFEAGTKTLYVHCPSGLCPDLFKMSIGAVYGFRKGGIASAYGGVDFQDRLTDIPSINLNKDPTFYGVLSFDSMTVKIINSDGEYDLLTREQNVFANKARVLLGFEGWDLTEFQQVFEGMIGKIKTDEDYLTIEVKDPRASLTKAIPENVFSTSVYTNLHSDDKNKSIPRVFGTCRNIPIFITDRAKTTGGAGATVTYTAKIGDTQYTTKISAVSAVYVNGINRTTSVGSLNLGTRTFTLNHSTHATRNKYNPGDEVTADVVGEVTSTGGVIQNGADVIYYLLRDYYEINYSNDFINLSKWDHALARNIGLWIGDKPKPLIDVIGDICSDGIQGDFFIDGNGKYCLRIWSDNRISAQTITRDQILKTPSIDDDPTKTITSTLIGYYKDWTNDEYRLKIDTSNEAEIFDKYPVYNQKRFDTLVPNSTEAQDYSDVVFSKSDDVETIINVEVPGWACIQREIGDVVIIYCNRRYVDWYKRAKCEVIGINKNLNSHIVSLTLRLIERMDDIPYSQGFFYASNSEASVEKRYYCGNSDSDRVYYNMTVNAG